MDKFDFIINDRYNILEEIDSGGTSDVYKAFDNETNREVALKVLKSEYCSDPDFVFKFENEATTALKFDCDSIVRTYDYGLFIDSENIKRRYISFEYVDGCNLKDSLKVQKILNVKTAANIALSILEALKYVHKAGFVHGDIKPQNVLVSTDKRILLSDFGVAQRPLKTQNRNEESMMGSIHYMSPTQLQGKTASIEDDIYAVGIIFYEMLLGKLPFDGDNVDKIAKQHLCDEIEHPMELMDTIPPAISDIVVKSTAKEESDRFHSAQEMQDAIKEAIIHPNKRIKLAGERKRSTSKILGAVIISAFVIFATFFCWFIIDETGKEKKEEYVVPYLLGKTQSEADEILKKREFNLVVDEYVNSDYPEGTICVQKTRSGELMVRGEDIHVSISLGSDSVIMIDLVGMTLSEAENALNDKGLKIGNILYIESSDFSPNTIIWQSESPNTELLIGDTVDVEVCRPSDDNQGGKH